MWKIEKVSTSDAVCVTQNKTKITKQFYLKALVSQFISNLDRDCAESRWISQPLKCHIMSNALIGNKNKGIKS